MLKTPQPAHVIQRRIDAAMGRITCDLILKNAKYLDVFGATFRQGDLAVVDGTVVSVDPGLKGTREIDIKGAHVVPGFIDAHVHVESSMMLPDAFESAVLPRGTTTSICDPHEITNVVGARGLSYFLTQAETLNMDMWVMMSSCVPATHLETNGGGIVPADVLANLATAPRALGLAEMMNVPGVLHADPSIMQKLAAFNGRPLDGHAPLLRGAELSAYAAAGISSCHESSELDEAQEKLSKGIAVWVREGSVAKDLATLVPLLTMATSSSMGFCTDDRNPYDIAEEGHLDYLLRRALATGVAPEVVYRAASWSVARHYALDRGLARIGAIAPGYQADLVVLDDVQTCAVQKVFKRGVLAGELATPLRVDVDLTGTVKASVPEAEALVGPKGMVHVIGVVPGKIITDHEVAQSDAPGVMRLSVLERYGHGLPPANAYVKGFGSLRGAIASSVGHDSHNLIVVGDTPQNMRTALAALIATGGGFAVARDGAVLASLALPHGGLMSTESPAQLRAAIAKLQEASRAIGCSLGDPFLQLAFLSLPVIPSLKLTDRGLVDVNKFDFISVAA